MASVGPVERAPNPSEQLALYWDPRYYSYFYAGVMTPPLGQLYDFTGAPIMLPRDTHSWSVVQLAQAENSTAAATRPIIIERDAQGQRKRPHQKRRISWNTFEVLRPVVAATAEREDASKDAPQTYSRTHSFVCCAVVLVVVFVLVLLFCLRVFTEQGRRNWTSSGAAVGPTTEGGMVVRPFVYKRVPPPPPPAVPEVTEGVEGRFLEDSANVSVNASEVPHLDVFVEGDKGHGVETHGNICVVSSLLPSRGDIGCTPSGALDGSSRCQRCDVFVQCCYSLQEDLILRPDIQAQSVLKNSTATMRDSARRRPASVLLGVQVDHEALRHLARRKGRVRFVRRALDVVKDGEFDGIRIWLPWHEGEASTFYDFVLDLAASVAPHFRRRKYTFGFFLPQEITRYRSIVSELKRTLNARYSLLLYFDFLALWNRTTGEWPPPKQVLVHASTEAEMHNNNFACYLLTWPRALSAHLSERCEHRNMGGVLHSLSVAIITLPELCKILDDKSLKTRAYKYYTYACKDRWAIYYQTALQILKFRRDFLAQASSSACIGSFDYSLQASPHACTK